MMNNIKKRIAEIIEPFRSQTETVERITLPAPRLRYGGKEFRDNAYFIASAKREAERLVKDFRLGVRTPILEIGCGVGRLPIGLLLTVGEMLHYRGVDVSPRAINWCSKYIQARHPGFQFSRIQMMNELYNPSGSELSTASFLPFSEKEFDVIYLYSVFSHMLTNDVEAYLREFNRVLSPGGKIFLTTFLEQDVPDVEVNPKKLQKKLGRSAALRSI